MATLDELPLSYRVFVRTYRWRRIDPVPQASLALPLAKARVALISSAGLVLRGQEPFDPAVRGGDFTFRVIPSEADPRELIDTHRSRAFDHGGMTRDRNLAFPIDRLRELERSGRIGALSRRAFSFMGSITAPHRLVTRSAPALAALLEEDGVDAALLVPV